MEATRVSKLLFGRPCRLPVALWVLQQGKRFHQSRPPTFGTTSHSNIREELARLVELEMVAREEPGDGRVYYEKVESPLWEVIDRAATILGLSWEGDRLIENPGAPKGPV